jgi:sugar phosphate isomerase/epimerase
MKLGIDSYCFHRLLGYVSPSDKSSAPSEPLSHRDFIELAHRLGAEAVSLQSLYLPEYGPGYLSEIRGLLDERAMERVYAWGHPNGLKGGTDGKAYDEMLEHLEYAKAIGADVMRVVGGYELSRREDHKPRLDDLAKMFTAASKTAERIGVRIAQENHNEYNSDELLWLIQAVESPFFGVTFDTGNFVRVLDDPVQAAEKLGKHTFATHIKDVKPDRVIPASEWNFFAAVPIGEGLVEIEKVIRRLLKSGYNRCLVVEVDFLHSEFRDPSAQDNELRAVELSLKRLRQISNALASSPARRASP